MGILEAIVVVYIRRIFYSTRFKFPLKLIPGSFLKTEILREFCTIIMLISIAFIANKNKLQRFAYFLFCFAIWDISYYFGLKIILGWPSSFFTWDVLFLIPFPWIAPVLAPLISSFSMIILSLTILFILSHDKNFRLKVREWLLIYAGAIIIFVSFMWSYSNILILNNFFKSPPKKLSDITLNFTPTHYHWDLFILGILLIGCSIFLMLRRYF